MRGIALIAALLAVTTVAPAAAAASVAPPAGHENVQPAAMSDAAFWVIIDRTADDSFDLQLAMLRSELEGLDAAGLEAFMLAFDRQMQRAYAWDLWGVGHVAYGGMSDDGFVYFRRWLISRGHEAYERLLARPDELARVAQARGPLEFEEIAYVAPELWVEKTGNDEGPPFPFGADGLGTEPAGEPFDDDPSALEQRYPLTWARFGGRPLE
jgi:hypothetical protein